MFGEHPIGDAAFGETEVDSGGTLVPRLMYYYSLLRS